MSYLSGPGAGEPASLGRTGAAERVPILIQKVTGQTAPLLQCIDVDGVTVLTQIDASGSISIGGSLSGAVILAPAISARNVVTPTVDNVTPLSVTGHSLTNSSPLLRVSNDPSLVATDAINVASDGATTISVSDTLGVPLTILNGFGGSQNALVVDYSFDGSGNLLGQLSLLSSGILNWQIKTTTTQHSPVQIVPSWKVNTEASRQGDLMFNIRDFNGTRVPLEMGANGTSALIGFLGATPVAQQTNGTAAALAAITDANAKSFLTAVSNGLVALGLFAAPV